MRGRLHALFTVVGIAVFLLGAASVTSSIAGASPSCEPDADIRVQESRGTDGRINSLAVTVAASADVPGGDRLTGVSLQSATNSRLEIDGAPTAIPRTISLPSPASWSFTVYRVAQNEPFIVQYTVHDVCGDFPSFAGAGMDGASTVVSATATPRVTRTATTTATRAPTMTATPSGTRAATATPTPLATATAAATSAPNPAMAIAPGTASLAATFKSISIELPFTGDPNGNAKVDFTFRRVGDSVWQKGLTLWRTGDASDGVFIGSVLLVDPGTQYQVHLVITDPDGVNGAASQTATVTTRADTIPAAASLRPTHFVRLDGSDSNPGTSNSPTGAWATLRKALKDAPAGAVVQVGSGAGTGDEFFPDSGLAQGAPGGRTTPITFVAPYPALDDQQRPINTGRRTVIEGGVRAAPSGQTVAGLPTAPWQPVTLVGPTDGVARTVWKWTNATSAGVTVHTLAYGTNRSDAFQRLWVWAKDSDRLATPAGWAELLYTNATLGYGFYQSGTDLYARLPGDGNPNQRWWSGDVGAGLAFNSPDSRVSGLVFRGLYFALRGGPGSDRLVVDHNQFQTVTSALRTSAELPADYAEDMVFEHNDVHNTGLWSTDQANAPSAPWDFVKRQITLPDGTLYHTTRIGGTMEGAAVIPVGSRRTVVRFNTLAGTFDGVGTVNVGSESTEDPHLNSEWDVHDNVIREIADDPFEPARNANWRIWNNRIEQTKTVLSSGSPTINSVLYFFRNTAWETGTAGLARDYQGGPAGGQNGMFFKYDGLASATTQARFYIINNTFWSDRAETYSASNAGGGGTYPEAFYLRNNIFRVGDSAFDYFSNPGGQYDEDANQFTTSNPAKGLRRISPKQDWTQFSAYQANSGQGAHSNLAIDLHDTGRLDAQFVSPSTGNLTLTSGSVLRAIGVPVPNIADDQGTDFAGAAPNLGATP